MLLSENMKIYITAIIVSVLVLGSCTKPKTVTAPTVFSLHCTDDYGNFLDGVLVNLYNDSTDWAKGTNVIYTGITSDSGNVTFSGIPSQRYYFSCHDTANCWINQQAYFLGNPLAANQTTAISLTLTGYGTLSVTNTSVNRTPYQININGKIWQSSLAYGQTISRIVAAQAYSLEAIQLGKYIGYQADIIYGINVNQCTATTQNIP